MRIGELTEIVDFQSPSDGEDDYGGKTIVYSDSLLNVPAKITTLRSDEAIVSMQTTAAAIHNCVVRYNPSITADMRIKHHHPSGSRYYEIIGPPIDLGMKHQWLDIKCRELK